MSAEEWLHMASTKRTICEVLREINDLHQGEDGKDVKTRALVVEAVSMAKRMTRKLKEYNQQVYAEWWDDNPDYDQDLERRLSDGYKL